MIHQDFSTLNMISLLAGSFSLFMLSSKGMRTKDHKAELNSLSVDSIMSDEDKLIMELREENYMLKEKLKTKTLELVTKAKEYDERCEMLVELKSGLEEILKHPGNTGSIVKSSLAKLESGLDTEDQTFQIQMDELHQDFIERLKNKFPDLSLNDHRLSTYILKGFSSKEIAGYLSIKPSSVYISRSRLRKKLRLDADADLHAYLSKI